MPIELFDYSLNPQYNYNEAVTNYFLVFHCLLQLLHTKLQNSIFEFDYCSDQQCTLCQIIINKYAMWSAELVRSVFANPGISNSCRIG